jgi:hypothetical protein
MNYYVTSQLVADRGAARQAECARRALVREARAARRAAAVPAVRPGRTRRLFLGRLTPAAA